MISTQYILSGMDEFQKTIILCHSFDKMGKKIFLTIKINFVELYVYYID